MEHTVSLDPGGVNSALLAMEPGGCGDLASDAAHITASAVSVLSTKSARSAAIPLAARIPTEKLAA